MFLPCSRAGEEKVWTTRLEHSIRLQRIWSTYIRQTATGRRLLFEGAFCNQFCLLMFTHYVNRPMQYTVLFTALKTTIFKTKSFSFFSSPEPKAHRWAYRIPMDPSSVRRPFTFSNIFSSETAWPIKAKFYLEPPWEGGTKVCINGPGHMTKMATMPIYGKNLKKSSSPEPAGLFPRNLVCSIGDSCSS